MPVILTLDDEISYLKSKLQAQELRTKKQFEDILSLKSELAEFRAENAELYDFNSSIFITIDKKNLIQTLNFQAAQFLGMTRKQLINKLFLHFLTTNSKNTFQKKIRDLFNKKTKQIFEVELITKDGNRKNVRIEITLKKSVLICMYLADITTLRQLEMQVSEAQKSLTFIDGLFQEADDALAVFDSALNIRIINKAFIELFSTVFSIKINNNSNISLVLSEFPNLKTKVINACQEAILGEKITLLLESDINKLYYCYRMIINPYVNPNSQRTDLVVRVTNITESKLKERQQIKLQAQLAIACRVSTMGEMSSAFAHEINQPLTAIIAYSRGCLFTIKNKVNQNIVCDKTILSTNKKTIENGSQDTPVYISTDDNLLSHQTALNKLIFPLEQISEQAELAGNIIHNMKNFMRNSSFQREETDINKVIKDTLAILNYELLDINLRITLNFTDYLPKIITNKIHIMQIIINLVRNSIEALQSVAEVSPELTIETRNINEHIVVHIIDNGPGIPPECQHKILKTYFTTKQQGTGIGLGICRSLIEDHGGELNINKTEKGAWFTFSLPINREQRSQ